MELVKYDAMCQAISECYKVDEVKGIRDKSLALEAYFKQAGNYDAETQASKIRTRAERKCGKLLKEMTKQESRAKGRPKKGSSKMTLSDVGVTKNQSSTWQKLAEIPEKEFETIMVEKEEPVSAHSVLAHVERKKQQKKAKKKPSPRELKRQEMEYYAMRIWGAITRLCREKDKYDTPGGVKAMDEIELEGTLAVEKDIKAWINLVFKECKAEKKRRK